MAFPLPKLLASFMELLPISNMHTVDVVENLQKTENGNFSKNEEELVSHNFNICNTIIFLDFFIIY